MAPSDRIVAADSRGISAAAALLRSGGVCAFPTETVYGLGGNALARAAVAEIYRLKGRPTWNPLIVHVRGEQHARSLAKTWPGSAKELAGAFWPGPLTLVLERSTAVPDYVSAGLTTIALRVPWHPVARALLDASDLPLAAPSANRSERLSPTRADHVVASLDEVPMVLDGGPCEYGIESTVIDVTCSPPCVLRFGALSQRHIEDVVGPVRAGGGTATGDGARSPGLGARHYAPQTSLVLLDRLDEAAVDALPQPLGIVTYRSPPGGLAGRAQALVVLPDDPTSYAAGLYSRLHGLDDGSLAAIAVLAPPPEREWDAVRDRLCRAACQGTMA